MTSVVPVLEAHPSVEVVRLVGSRAAGTATALSDWDFAIDAEDPWQLAVELPSLTRSLRPLAAQWDRLSRRLVFMVVLDGAIKVDLFPGDLPHEPEGPWEPDGTNLSDIDAHFWDWTIWIASKALAGHQTLVRDELAKLFIHLFAPLGAGGPPSSLGAALRSYQSVLQAAEVVYGVRVDPRLGRAVRTKLRECNIC